MRTSLLNIISWALPFAIVAFTSIWGGFPFKFVNTPAYSGGIFLDIVFWVIVVAVIKIAFLKILERTSGGYSE